MLSGSITNVTSNRPTSDVTIGWSNTGSVPEVTLTIRDKKTTTTVPSFGIRLTTIDADTAIRTTGSQYSMEIPNVSGIAHTYDMGTTGTALRTGFTSNGTYILRQTRVSTGGYQSVSEIRLTVTRNAQREYN